MANDKKTPFGGIAISANAIEEVASEAALNSYGVAGLSQRTRGNKPLDIFLDSKTFSKGAIATKSRSGWTVDVYIIVVYGLKITEIISGVQSRVKYELEKTFDMKLRAVNIYIQGVKVM
ncbi:MAG TPA: Asp23/Gls24 family envelope stress response protein [Bacilli bacterium]|nr:Asp23/Gls24 family envelope stress response protein [Bacilli bacterium]HPK86090.1 Asp23/Gls24 family envelope stress response protein [Bacilli bacterium]